MEKREENLILLMFIVSLIATLGSLYFSEIKGFEPCKLCWFQRILMYPMAIILFISLISKNINVYLYTLVFSIFGVILSGIHNLILIFPSLIEKNISCGLVPCSTDYISYFGFINIPLMSLVAFLIIFIISVYIFKLRQEKHI